MNRNGHDVYVLPPVNEQSLGKLACYDENAPIAVPSANNFIHSLLSKIENTEKDRQGQATTSSTSKWKEHVTQLENQLRQLLGSVFPSVASSSPKSSMSTQQWEELGWYFDGEKQRLHAPPMDKGQRELW